MTIVVWHASTCRGGPFRTITKTTLSRSAQLSETGSIRLHWCGRLS